MSDVEEEVAEERIGSEEEGYSEEEFDAEEEENMGEGKSDEENYEDDAFDEEENEKLFEFDKKHNGKPTANDWKQLALEMGRPRTTLHPKLKKLKESKDVSQTLKGSKYTLEDEAKILSYLNEHFEIGNVEELNSLHRNDFLPLVKVFQRHEMPIYHHFKLFLLPHVRKCLWFSEPYLNGKMTF